MFGALQSLYTRPSRYSVCTGRSDLLRQHTSSESNGHAIEHIEEVPRAPYLQSEPREEFSASDGDA